MPADNVTPLKRTPLYPLHQALGARMVPFAGYEMPVQYPAGILAEHLHTRAQAGLFDVSHMGQLRLAGPDPAAALEALVPGDLRALGPMRMRYTLLLNDSGGILDDLMATRLTATRLAANFSSSSTPTARRPISPICATISAGAPRSTCLTIGHCWPCRGRPPPPRCRASATASPSCRS